MVKRRIGPSASVIKGSQGGQSSLRSFYMTSYQAFHGDDNFVLRNAKPVGTGYKANFRPEICYSKRLDDLDNVQLGKELKENYSTSYVKQHRPYYTGSNGNDKLSLTILPYKSGYTQQRPITSADSKSVTEARLLTMTSNVYKPLLRRLKEKRISQLDDGSLVPTTETKTCYLGKPSVRMCTFMKDVGLKEPSSYTHFHHFDPVTYLDRNPFDGTGDGCKTLRPTGITEQQGHFVRWPCTSGKEMNSGIRKRAKRETGYSNETTHPCFVHRNPEDAFTTVEQLPSPVAERIKKQDPCEYYNLTKGREHSSLANCNFDGRQRPPNSLNYLLSRISVGRKELTGFSTNNVGHVETADNKSPFISSYNVKFGPKPPNYPRHAQVSGFTKQTNGFTKSTVVHSFGDGIPFRSADLRRLHPLAAKVMKRENPCYIDNTRNFKLRLPVTS